MQSAAKGFPYAFFLNKQKMIHFFIESSLFQYQNFLTHHNQNMTCKFTAALKGTVSRDFRLQV